MFFNRKGSSWPITVLIGLSICAFAWNQWKGIQQPSRADLDAAVELQYQKEISRMTSDANGRPAQVSPEWQDKFHSAIRAELMRPVDDQLRQVYGFLALGLITLVIGIGSFISERLAKNGNQSSP